MSIFKRRLGLTVALVFVLGVPFGRPVANAETGASGDPLAQLMDGNVRFVEGQLEHPNADPARRKSLVGGQHPIATILACSDSRVPAELVFDQGLGDIFVVRVAGNVAASSEIGSVEYAVHHLHTPLVLVLGHESCGAVTAALLSAEERAHEAREIQELLSMIVPSLGRIDAKLPQAERVHRGVEANVRATVKQLRENPALQAGHEGPAPKIVGGVYDLATGKVRLLN
ncbi:MAG TPA: carbonic anhydrase [Thermoanaerobaculia bacterium]|nr:carbonic anhydrase [Thermoanaerobaculia bacterium]